MHIFYDTHAHLDYPDFEAELPQIIERAQAAGITKIISIGTDLESSRRAVALAERFGNVFAVAGWHPTHATAAPEDFRAELREVARHPKVVAIGETGMDYHRLPSSNREQVVKEGGAPGQTRPTSAGLDLAQVGEQDDLYKAKQARIFEQQLEVAAELGLNTVIHQRDAMEDTLKIMERFAGRVRGVFHCFSNGPDALRRILEMGSMVSFTGIVSFKNAQNVREVLAATPFDSFMLETDCPYLAPVPYRGKRCEPAYVKEISEVVAEVKGCSLDKLSAETSATASKFFPKLG